MAAEWRNWTGDQRCVPAAIFHPRTLDGLIYAGRQGSEGGPAVPAGGSRHSFQDAGLPSHAAGSAHSFTDAALTSGAMVRIEALNRMLDVDRGTGLVKVEAGITLADLSALLWEHGLALENL